MRKTPTKALQSNRTIEAPQPSNPAATRRAGSIVLARHGEPALSRKVRLTAREYRDWWALYEAGGIIAGQSPPEHLKTAADQAAGLARVAVVDFDVHHGNGTQDCFLGEPDLFYASVHQWPCYPGTGRDGQTPNVVNAVAPPMAPREVWRAAFQRLMTPLDAFAPDLIIVSAGFDAHARDPLAQQTLEAEDFAWATRAICEVARSRCGGKVVSSLEGGYDLQALGRSAVAHVRALGEG